MSFLCPCSTNRADKRYSVGQSNKVTSKEISKRIDRQLKAEKKARELERRMLLLGTAASGKSTFLRSIRILHRDRFDEFEVTEFKVTIYTNILKGIMKLLYVKKELKIKWKNTKPSIAAVKAILALQQRFPNWNNYKVTEDMFLEAAPDIRTIWADEGMQEAYEKRHLVAGSEEFRDIGENLDFYLNRLSDIDVKGYMPTDEHILHSRRFTDSVSEKVLVFNGTPLRIIDIGGHSNERRKWVKMFQGELNTVIYIIAASSFNENYMKDTDDDCEVVNKLDESFVCLRLLAENRTLVNQSMSLIIFFNKNDMLAHKIEDSKIDYSKHDLSFDVTEHDPLNLGHVREHLIRRLNATLPPQIRRYHHFTTSIDLKNMLIIFKDIKRTVMQNNLHEMLPS